MIGLVSTQLSCVLSLKPRLQFIDFQAKEECGAFLVVDTTVVLICSSCIVYEKQNWPSIWPIESFYFLFSSTDV